MWPTPETIWTIIGPPLGTRDNGLLAGYYLDAAQDANTGGQTGCRPTAAFPPLDELDFNIPVLGSDIA